MSSMTPITKFIDFMIELQLKLAMLALVVMMLVVVADVVMRYTLHMPLRGSYDLVEICLLVSVFFGIGSVISRRREIVIDLIDGVAAKPAVLVLKRIAGLASVAVTVFIFWSMLRPAYDTYLYGDVKLELNLPVWIIWAMALFGLAGGVLASIRVLFGENNSGTNTALPKNGSAQ